MAGIGFTLRKLMRKDDLLGVFAGYTHSAVASTGPWIFTILSLGAITLLGPRIGDEQALIGFRILVIYNFAFSLVMSGPITMLATRYLSDLIYKKDVSPAPGMLLGGLTLLFAAQAAIVLPFYLFYLNLEMPIRMAAIAHFFLVSGIWLVCQFLSALKEYNAVSRAFGIGMLIATVGVMLTAPTGSVAGMLAAFSIGLAWIFFSLVARVFSEYPHAVHQPFALLRYFKQYWELALSGLAYNLAVWIDKWMMWLAPQREFTAFGLVSYPDYDGAMFLAYLTILPSMALFVFSIETAFFESYLRFYRDIQRFADYEKIEKNHRDLIQVTLSSARTFLLVQGGVTLAVLVMSPGLFNSLGIGFSQLGIFRFGVLGALFHALFLFLSIFLSYFDLRRPALWLQLLFLASNALFTWGSMKMGLAYYGSGYLLAALVSFVAAFFVTTHYLNQLPYQTFIRGNTSLHR
jgi:polysaccharide biosynthesis protein PelG